MPGPLRRALTRERFEGVRAALRGLDPHGPRRPAIGRQRKSPTSRCDGGELGVAAAGFEPATSRQHEDGRATRLLHAAGIRLGDRHSCACDQPGPKMRDKQLPAITMLDSYPTSHANPRLAIVG